MEILYPNTIISRMNTSVWNMTLKPPETSLKYSQGGWDAHGNVSLNHTLLGGNTSEGEPEILPPGFEGYPYEIWLMFIIGLILGVLTVGTVLGNILVCTAVAIVRKLQTPSNLLIVSLAVSDLLVGLLVMPLAVVNELHGYWALGERLCDAWVSMDVMLCTASILNLCCISVDRYLVITRPFQYAVKRTPRRMAYMIAGVWLASALISIPPLFGWKSRHRERVCIPSQEISYQFYATIGAFYLPLAVMIVLYYRIFKLSSKIAKAEAKSKAAGCSSLEHSQVTNTSKRPSSSSEKEENHNVCPNGNLKRRSDDTTASMLPKRSTDSTPQKLSAMRRFNFKSLRPRTAHMRGKESKATKTLGVIMGAFTACWIPFFIVALIRPFCSDPDNCIPGWIHSIFLWLGYTNSLLNPIIYARFNRDFRTPFKEILCFRCKGINIRLRSESYVEQYGFGPPSTGHLRDTIKPPVDTVVKYDSQGQTIVKLGNGSAADSKSKNTAKV